jgi:2-methylisocitrate lyase-like PEP mutase family enzyme
MSTSTADKRAKFRKLHADGCFVIPNPWDLGSALYLQHLGFEALATSSAGFAWSKGRPDNGVRVGEVLAHLTEIAGGVDVPVNADFEGGFAVDLESLGTNVARAVATGIAGLSIEDSSGNPDDPLYEMPIAMRRISTARAAIDRVDPTVMLVGRSEGFIAGRPDLAETIRRLQAYAQAGADCLFAPGLRTPEEIAAVVKAVAPKPVNFVAGSPAFTVASLAELGVRRISVGGALARAAWGEFMRVASEIAEVGTFTGMGRAAPSAELNRLFGQRSQASPPPGIMI